MYKLKKVGRQRQTHVICNSVCKDVCKISQSFDTQNSGFGMFFCFEQVVHYAFGKRPKNKISVMKNKNIYCILYRCLLIPKTEHENKVLSQSVSLQSSKYCIYLKDKATTSSVTQI